MASFPVDRTTPSEGSPGRERLKDPLLVRYVEKQKEKWGHSPEHGDAEIVRGTAELQ